MIYTANHPERGLTPPDNDGLSFEEIEKKIVLTRLWDDLEYYQNKRKESPNRLAAIDRLIDYIRKQIEITENN